jgi:hypothetical protein
MVERRRFPTIAARLLPGLDLKTGCRRGLDWRLRET